MIMTFQLKDFAKGQRVQLHPALDRWARGDRYGEVAKIGRLYVHVRMDRTNALVVLVPSNIYEILGIPPKSGE
jgi:hypothetical protein